MSPKTFYIVSDAAHTPRCAAKFYHPTENIEEAPQFPNVTPWTLSSSRVRTFRLFREVKIVSEPLPRLYLRHSETRLAVRERRKEEEAPEHDKQNDASGDPATQLAGGGHALTDRTRSSSAVTFNSRRFGVQRFDAEDEFD